MSIAVKLDRSVTKLRALIQRSNGDILEAGPAILEDMEAEIDRVKNLEMAVALNCEQVREFEVKGAEYGESNAN